MNGVGSLLGICGAKMLMVIVVLGKEVKEWPGLTPVEPVVDIEKK